MNIIFIAHDNTCHIQQMHQNEENLTCVQKSSCCSYLIFLLLSLKHFYLSRFTPPHTRTQKSCFSSLTKEQIYGNKSDDASIRLLFP